MTDQARHTRRAFLRAEHAFREAAKALWQASGTTNASWEERTLIEVAARRYVEAANDYRSQTRALFKTNTKTPSEDGGVTPAHSIK